MRTKAHKRTKREDILQRRLETEAEACKRRNVWLSMLDQVVGDVCDFMVGLVAAEMVEEALRDKREVVTKRLICCSWVSTGVGKDIRSSSARCGDGISSGVG